MRLFILCVTSFFACSTPHVLIFDNDSCPDDAGQAIDGSQVSDGDLEDTEIESDADEAEDSDIFVFDADMPQITVPAPDPLVEICIEGGSQVDLSVEESGHLFVAGQSFGTLKIGENLYGETDSFVARFTTDGVLSWLEMIDDVTPTAVTTLPSGDVVIAGYFTGYAEIWGYALKAEGEQDLLIAALNSESIPVWLRTFGTESFERFTDVITDTSGDLVAAGEFRGSSPFGESEGSQPSNDRDWDTLLARFTSEGELVSSAEIRVAGRNFATGLAPTGTSEIAVVGNIELRLAAISGETYGDYDELISGSLGIFGSNLDAGFLDFFSDGVRLEGVAATGDGLIAVGFTEGGDLGTGSLFPFGDQGIFISGVENEGSNTGEIRWATGIPGTASISSVLVTADGDSIITGRFLNLDLGDDRWVSPDYDESGTFVLRVDNDGVPQSAFYYPGTGLYEHYHSRSVLDSHGDLWIAIESSFGGDPDCHGIHLVKVPVL